MTDHAENLTRALHTLNDVAAEIARLRALIAEQQADLVKLRTDRDALEALLDDHRIREVLGFVEDHGQAHAWAYAQSWMAGRDAALARMREES